MSSIPLNLTSIHSDGGASLVGGRAVQPLTTQCTSDAACIFSAGTCSLEPGPPIRGCLEGIRLHGGVRIRESQHNLSKVQCRYRQEILDHPPAGLLVSSSEGVAVHVMYVKICPKIGGPTRIWLRPAEAEAAETNMAPEVKLRAFEGDDHFVLGSEHALAGLQKVFTSSKGDSAEG